MGYIIGLSEDTTFEHELSAILQDRCLLKVYNKTVTEKHDVNVIEKDFWINDKHPSKENFKTFLDQDFIRRQGRAIQIAKFADTGDEIALIESVSNVVHICQIVVQTRKDPKTVMRFLSNMRAYCYPLFAKSHNADGSLSLSFMHCSCTQQYGVISKTHRFHKLQ
uniref:RNA-directed RNA polymerase n=1 Tax=Panagrellus redivivus TaxID=6233 RepID=A0A7E5A1E7_PANRE